MFFCLLPVVVLVYVETLTSWFFNSCVRSQETKVQSAERTYDLSIMEMSSEDFTGKPCLLTVEMISTHDKWSSCASEIVQCFFCKKTQTASRSCWTFWVLFKISLFTFWCWLSNSTEKKRKTHLITVHPSGWVHGWMGGSIHTYSMGAWMDVSMNAKKTDQDKTHSIYIHMSR